MVKNSIFENLTFRFVRRFVGNVGVNELLSSLIEAVEVFTEHQRVEIVEEKERAERELVKWEQDEAYRESLEADR
jgi:hypothetical protein